MKRFSFVVLLLLSSVSFAGSGDPVPLCPEGPASECVVPNWGVIEPGVTDNAGTAEGSPSVAAARLSTTARIGVRMMPTATTSSSRTLNATPPIQSVVSPQGLFPKETAALVAALKRARFNADGSIATGEAAIRRAAEAATKQAGTKYTLTLYIKLSRKIAPDRSASLGKKVDALNAVLGGAHDGGQAAAPRS